MDGCREPLYARDWCRIHYARWYRKGSTERFELPPIRDRIFAKLAQDPETCCWLWQGSTSGGFRGRWYGEIQYERRRWPVHRLVYTLFVGEVPDGMVIDHMCGEPRCCNPGHLEAVSHAENIRRGYEQKRQRQAFH